MKKFLLLLVAVPVLAQNPVSLPARDPLTTNDLKLQLAECAISMGSEQRYEKKLEARIAELEKQLADARSAKPEAPPLPKVTGK